MVKKFVKVVIVCVKITHNGFGLCVRWRLKPQMLNWKTKLDMSKNDELINETANGTKPMLGEVKFVPNTNYSRTTHNDIDYYIGVNGKVKTKFFGK